MDETLDVFAHGTADQRTAIVELSSFGGSVEDFTDVLHMLDAAGTDLDNMYFQGKSVLMLTENDSWNGCRKDGASKPWKPWKPL